MKILNALLLLCFFNAFSQEMQDYNGFIENKGTCHFFYEVKGDSLLPARVIVFKDMDTIGLSEIISFKTKWGKKERHIRLLGNKSNPEKVIHDGFSYNKITAKLIDSYSLGDFRIDPHHIIATIKKDTILEGYVNEGWKETHYFKGIKDDSIEDTYGVIFQYQLSIYDSLIKIPGFYDAYKHGVYMQIHAVKEYDGRFHGGRDLSFYYTLKIKKIIKVDIARTYCGDLIKKLEKGYITEKDTIWLPKDFEMGRKYFFKGKYKDLRARLEVQKTAPGILKYNFNYYRKKKNIASFSGKMILGAPGYIRATKEPDLYDHANRYEYSVFWWDEARGYADKGVRFEVPLKDDKYGTPDFLFYDETYSVNENELVFIVLEPTEK